jgi:pimeloyl-ACP methyl ester carboxylesterase
MTTHLFLIPGIVCDAAVWAHQAESLRTLATVRIVDHGTADSLEKMAQAVLDDAPGRFALAGHSMGGRVAMEIVRRAPERISGLALLDTAYQPRSAGEAGERERAERHELLRIAEIEGMRAMGIRWVQQMVHPNRLSDAVLMESILDMICRKNPAIFAAQIRALLSRPDAEPALKAVRCPTMILCGRQDAWNPLARHEDMAAMIQGSTLAVVEDCGHMSPMERPLEVTAMLREWLEGIARS